MSYSSELSDVEWDLIKKDFQAKTKRGSSHKHDKKQIVNAILYLVKGGISWRMMPKDFPPWQTVYDHFSR
jgi:putative transposase